jgi:hypothetical protein
MSLQTPVEQRISAPVNAWPWRLWQVRRGSRGRKEG